VSTGLQLKGLIKSPDSTSMATITVFVNFSTDNPRRRQVSYFKQEMKKIIASFRFM
jgi:hypothetical protein